MIFQLLKELAPFPSCGIVTVTILSCVLFGIQTFFNLTQAGLSVGASVFLNGHIYRLLTYSFYHQTSAQLLFNIAALLFLCSSLEKGFGTVRFLLLFPVLSTTTGLFYSLEDLLQYGGDEQEADGLLPAVLACVTLTTTRTKVSKGFLCGISFPSMALPWILLILAWFAPRSRMPCNITAILVGWVHGKGWFSLLEVSEAKAGALEKMLPFRLLRRMSGATFVPASMKERRKTVLPQINPTPGSYPVQAYAPLSTLNAVHSTGRFHEGWPSVSSLSAAPEPAPELRTDLWNGPVDCTESHFGHSSKELRL